MKCHLLWGYLRVPEITKGLESVCSCEGFVGGGVKEMRRPREGR